MQIVTTVVAVGKRKRLEGELEPVSTHSMCQVKWLI
jgi:hypothetical protein